MTLPKDPSKHAEYRRKMSHKGIKRSPETCERIRLSKKGKKNPNMHRDVSGDKNPNFGHHLSEEAKERIRQARKNLKGKIKFPQEARDHISESKKGAKNPFYNKTHTLESLRKISRKGEKNPAWKGGISFEPYCPKFTDEFKERVRAFFGYQCQKCGHIWKEGEKKLAVHHVNYRKDACCAMDVIPLFVPLCAGRCHGKTTVNRIFWQYWFTEMVNYIYEGKCYFSREEMIAYGKREDNGDNLDLRSPLYKF